MASVTVPNAYAQQLIPGTTPAMNGLYNLTQVQQPAPVTGAVPASQISAQQAASQSQAAQLAQQQSEFEQQFGAAQQQTALKNQAADETQSAALAALSKLGTESGAGTTSTGYVAPPPPAPYVAPAPPPSAPALIQPSMAAATSAATTAAKESAGQALAGESKALNGLYEGRGMLNSGIAAKGLDDLVAQSGEAEDQAQAGLLEQGLTAQQQAAQSDLAAQEGYGSELTGYNENVASGQNAYDTAVSNYNQNLASGENSYSLEEQQLQQAARNQAMSSLTSLLQAAGALY